MCSVHVQTFAATGRQMHLNLRNEEDDFVGLHVAMETNSWLEVVNYAFFYSSLFLFISLFETHLDFMHRYALHINGELQHVPKEVRQTRLMDWITNCRTESYMGNMRVGYAFYDLNEDGALEVVCNENYNQTFASMVDNLRGIH